MNDSSVTLDRQKVKSKSFPVSDLTKFDKAMATSKRRSANGAVLSKNLREAAKDNRQRVISDLLELNSRLEANGVLQNLEDKQGRKFECAISLEFTFNRLSDSYQQRQATRQRKRIQRVFSENAEYIKANDYKILFFTPTFTNLLGVSFQKNAELHALAWELFLRNEIVREQFLGGYNRTEFTLGNKHERTRESRNFDLDKDGLNWHSHALTILKSSIAFGNSQDLENKLENLKDKKSIEAKEERKLIKKSLKITSIWTESIQAAHLRIFKKKMKIDNTKSKRFRCDFKEIPLSEIESHDDANGKGILFEIAGYTGKQANFIGLSPKLLSEAEEVFEGKRILNPFGRFKAKPKEKIQADDPLLKPATYRQEKEVKITSNSNIIKRLEPKRKTVILGKSLKQIGIEMCDAGNRDAWLKHLSKIEKSLINRKREKLLSHFPKAIFTDLKGNRYYGREYFGTKEKLSLVGN